MAKRRKTWKTEHKMSGATIIERRTQGCRLTVMPLDWAKPRGAASWTTSCRANHKRGRAKTVKSAKAAATRAAKTMRR